MIIPNNSTLGQAESIDMLSIILENLEVEFITSDKEEYLIFEGEGVEGKEIGYIETDGKVSWVVGG